MLVPANATDPGDGFGSIGLKARGQKKTGLLGEYRVKNGLGIGPLRATGGPPGGVLSAVSGEGKSASLVEPPESGLGVLGKLQGQVRSVSPLTAGLGSQRSIRSLGATQATLVKARQQFQQIDGRSRFLQARNQPRREESGFGFSLFSSTLDLLG